MIQERQKSVERRFQGYDQHPRGRKSQVEDDDGGQEEEENSEQYCAKEKLVEVIIA